MTLLDVEGHLFRAFPWRVLRPLRMIQFSVVVQPSLCTIIAAAACKLTVGNNAVQDEGCIHRARLLPTVVAVVMLSFLFYITFAILGVGLFMGQFYRCDCGGDQKARAKLHQRLGVRDSLRSARRSVGEPLQLRQHIRRYADTFICSTTEGCEPPVRRACSQPGIAADAQRCAGVDIMNSGMDATPELAPEQDINYGLAIYSAVHPYRHGMTPRAHFHVRQLPT